MESEQLHCGIAVRAEGEGLSKTTVICDSPKGTKEYRVVGGIAETSVPICESHAVTLMNRKPHWHLYPQVHG